MQDEWPTPKKLLFCRDCHVVLLADDRNLLTKLTVLKVYETATLQGIRENSFQTKQTHLTRGWWNLAKLCWGLSGCREAQARRREPSLLSLTLLSLENIPQFTTTHATQGTNKQQDLTAGFVSMTSGTGTYKQIPHHGLAWWMEIWEGL